MPRSPIADSPQTGPLQTVSPAPPRSFAGLGPFTGRRLRFRGIADFYPQIRRLTASRLPRRLPVRRFFGRKPLVLTFQPPRRRCPAVGTLTARQVAAINGARQKT